MTVDIDETHSGWCDLCGHDAQIMVTLHGNGTCTSPTVETRYCASCYARQLDQEAK